jgi:type IV pilus assembly protein PilO
MASKLSDLPPAVQGTVLAVVPLILAGVAFWYFVWPLSDKLTAAKAQLASLHAQNLKNQSIERQRGEFQRRLAQLDAELETFRSRVPDEPSPDELVKMVHDAELAAAVHIRSFVAQPLVPQEMYVEMPFKVRLDGTYYAMANFFNRLTQAQRIVGVSNLTLGSPAPTGSGKYSIDPEATVGVNCVVTTYFNRPQSMAAPKKKK